MSRLTTLEPSKAEKESEKTQEPARVILYNDDWHSFDDVIIQLVKATGMNPEKALEHAHNIHNLGRDIVYRGARDQCEKVAGILREIRLQTEVDWDD